MCVELFTKGKMSVDEYVVVCIRVSSSCIKLIVNKESQYSP